MPDDFSPATRWWETPGWLPPGLRLEQRLGVSAQGGTWRARELATGDVVVVKARQSDRPEFSPEQVSRAAGRLAEVRHPHLVRLRSVRTLPTGVVLVRDHAEGGSLDELIAAHSHLTPGEVVTIGVPLAAALGALHDAGLVHGAVTSGNVLFDGAGRPLLADYGVAALVSASGNATGATDATAARDAGAATDAANARGAAANPTGPADASEAADSTEAADAMGAANAAGAAADTTAADDVLALTALLAGVLPADAPPALKAVLHNGGGHPIAAGDLGLSLRAACSPAPVRLGRLTPLGIARPGRLETARPDPLEPAGRSPVGPARRTPLGPRRRAASEPPEVPPVETPRPALTKPSRPAPVEPPPPAPVEPPPPASAEPPGPTPTEPPRRGRLTGLPPHKMRRPSPMLVVGGPLALVAAVAVGRAWAAADRPASPPPLPPPKLAAQATVSLTSPATSSPTEPATASSTAPALATAWPTAPAPATASPTASSAVDWLAVLTKLDQRRDAAMVNLDASALAEVYAADSLPLAGDAASIRLLAAAGARADGLRLEVRSAQLVRRTAAEVTLRVADRLAAYEIVAADGRVLERRPGRGPVTWLVTLVPAGDGWRISALERA